MNKHGAKARVRIGVDVEGLDEDFLVLGPLLEAVRIMDTVYLKQMNQDGVPKDGVIDRSRGNCFYPNDLTKEEFEAYCAKHPESAEILRDPRSVVRREGTKLVAFPFADFFKSYLFRVDILLKRAAMFTQNESLERFLRERGSALYANRLYSESEVSWMNITDASLELTIGSYEDYDDTLLGIKRSFEAILGVVVRDETEKLLRYREVAREFDAALARDCGYTPT